MVLTRFYEVFQRVSELISRIAYVNILWILFSLLGFVVVGFFPATVAMFAVVRKLKLNQGNVPIFKTFWGYYNKEFLRSNFLGLVFVLIGGVLYFDLRYLSTVEGFLQLLYYPVLLGTFVFFLMSLYIFPMYVHYEIKLFQLIKNSFLIMAMNPPLTIIKVMGMGIIYLILMNFPGLIPFFGGSIFAFLLVTTSLITFTKAEDKREQSGPETSVKVIN